MVLPLSVVVGEAEALSITQRMQLVETLRLRLALVVPVVNAAIKVMAVRMQLVLVVVMGVVLSLARLRQLAAAEEAWGMGGLAVFPVPMAEAVAPILVMVEQELMDILEVRDLIVILPAAPVVEVELEVLE